MQTSIIVANLKNPATSAVFQMLRDWTVAGLVGESVWMDIDDPSNIIRVRGGDVDTLPVAGWTTTIKDTPRFFAIQVLKDASAGITKEQVSKAIGSVGAFQGIVPNLVNVLFPLSDSKSNPSVYFENNLNLVALPFDSVNPTSNGEPIDSKSRIYFGHCSKELATIVGLWPGQTESVLDGIEILSGSNSNVVVERTFVRYVDASNFVKSVISKVIDGSGKNLPTPLEQGHELVVIPSTQEGRVAEDLSLSFLAGHPQIQYTKFANRFGQSPLQGNFLEVLKYYFKWIWNWLRRQPATILKEKFESFKVSAAKSIQGMVGTNSRIMVEVGGRTAHANPTGMSALANDVIIETFSQQYDSLRVPEQAKPLELWKDFAEVALSLADGKKLSNDRTQMPVLEDGISRRVITNPFAIVPNFRENEFQIPTHLNVPCKGHRLSASDPLTALLVQKGIADSIQASSFGSSNAREISALKEDLQAWRNSNKSFTWLVGDRIAEGISSALDAWEEIGKRVETINSDSLVEAERKAQKRLTRLFMVSFGLIATFLIGWLIQALLIYSVTHSWPPLAKWWTTPAMIIGGIVLLWNALGLSMVYSAIKKLFQLQHELQSDNRANQDTERSHILGEINRLTQYYRQYQAWVAIISAFVHSGSKSQGAESGEISLGKSAPQALTVATLLPNLDANEGDLAKKIASDYYQTGWLTALMQDVLSSAVGNYGDITLDNLSNPTKELAKAQEWATSKEVSGDVKNRIVQQIQTLATKGSAYQSWMVQLTNALGEKQLVSGSEIIGQLGVGTSFMPTVAGFTTQGISTAGAELDRTHSACAFDERLGLASDFERTIKVLPNQANGRELDFLGLRFEATSLIHPSDVAIFGGDQKKPTVASQDGEADKVVPETPA